MRGQADNATRATTNQTNQPNQTTTNNPPQPNKQQATNPIKPAALPALALQNKVWHQTVLPEREKKT
jgi:hypothetical protein